MTGIVNCPTKKSLREALEEMPENVIITEPNPFHSHIYSAEQMRIGQSVTVTNHPKRSYFATITKTKEGYTVK